MSLIGPAIIGIGSIVGGLIASNASGNAAESQSEAAQAAAEAQLQAAHVAGEYGLMGAEMAANASIKAAGIAAGATRDAAKIAAAVQREMFNLARSDNLPWLRVGKKALKQLERKIYAGPGEFTESPGYQFRLDQGNKNILANASATGNLASGRTLTALQEYGQEYASNEYDKFLNRYYQSLQPLQNLATMGQNAAAMTGSQAMTTGANLGNTYTNMGNSLASIYSNQGNQLSGIYSAMGTNMANNAMNVGAINADNFMAQGNIAAASSINQANAWTSAINSGLQGLGHYWGSQQQYQYNPWESYYNMNMPGFGTSGWREMPVSQGMGGIT